MSGSGAGGGGRGRNTQRKKSGDGAQVEGSWPESVVRDGGGKMAKGELTANWQRVGTVDTPSTRVPFLCTSFSLPSVHFGIGAGELPPPLPRSETVEINPFYQSMCREKKVNLEGGEANCLPGTRTQRSKISLENVLVWCPRREKKWRLEYGWGGAEEVGEGNVG